MCACECVCVCVCMQTAKIAVKSECVSGNYPLGCPVFYFLHQVVTYYQPTISINEHNTLLEDNCKLLEEALYMSEHLHNILFAVVTSLPGLKFNRYIFTVSSQSQFR